MGKLTKTRVDALLPTGKRYAVTDSTLPGFEIRVGISGTKTAAVIYRKGGRLRRVTLGKIGEAYPFGQARADAAATLIAVKAGRDPAAERTVTRGAPTLKEASERYMGEVRARCKPTTVRKYDNVLKHQILPALGPVRVCDVGPEDVQRLHAKLGVTMPASANYAVTVLRAIMGRAEAWGMKPRGSNPCMGIERFPMGARSRVLTAEERARLELVLAEAEGSGLVGPGHVAVIRLLSLTAARCSEIIGLRWDEVDLDRAVLRLADSKTGPRPVPLSKQARDFLATLHERRGESPWVCPGNGGAQVKGIHRAWHRLRLRAGLPDVKIHDLRRSAATDAIEAGVPVAMVGGVLGHRSIRTTEIYLHPSLSSFQEAAQRMGDRIEQQTNAGAEKLREKK